MIRYRITILLLIVAILAMGLGWLADRSEFQLKLDHHDSNALLDALDMAVVGKYGQHTPTTYIDETMSDLESLLSLTEADGESLKSTGWSVETLRKPSAKTTDLAIEKLKSDSRDDRLNALKLLALYSEAFNVEQKYAFQQLEPAEQHFCDNVPTNLRGYLADLDAEIRAHAALAVGFTCRERETIDKLTFAFKNETDGTAKMYMAWAIARQF